ncbi:hypothetical protein ETB97_006404, partial [Aspergillus alliaceus]
MSPAWVARPEFKLKTYNDLEFRFMENHTVWLFENLLSSSLEENWRALIQMLIDLRGSPLRVDRNYCSLHPTSDLNSRYY